MINADVETLIEIYRSYFSSSSRTEAGIMAERVIFIHETFAGASASCIHNPEGWFMNFIDTLKMNGVSPVAALWSQAHFLEQRFVNGSQFSRMCEYFESLPVLDMPEQEIIFKFLWSCPLHDVFRSVNVLDNDGDDINVLPCVLSMKAYSALKTGHSRVRNPAPDVSLDSVCLCASAVTSSAFTRTSSETRQVDSFIASLMLGPALHISQPQVIIRCMKTLSLMISGLYRELRAMCPQMEERHTDIEEQAVPLFTLTADNKCGNELQRLELQKLQEVKYHATHN